MKDQKGIVEKKLKTINNFLKLAKKLEEYKLLQIITGNEHLFHDEMHWNIHEEKCYLENFIKYQETLSF